jgi:3D (Asp-Asp-Asp) domain-containing protein
MLVLWSVVCAVSISMAAVVAAQSDARPAVMVTVIADGQEWQYVSCGETVGAILSEAGVPLGEKDRVYPGLQTQAYNGARIRVTRIEEKLVVQTEPIGFKRTIKFNPYSTTGRRVICEGVPGEKEVKYLVTYKDGVKVGHKVLEARVVKEPLSEIVSLSRGAVLTSRDGSYLRSLRMIATAYTPFHCGGSRSGRTACGMPAGYGIVAVDPRVISLGTKLYVEGYGVCVAGDTGGAIKGSRIDLGFDTYSQAIRFGRRRVSVYVLE